MSKRQKPPDPIIAAGFVFRARKGAKGRIYLDAHGNLRLRRYGVIHVKRLTRKPRSA